MRYVLTFLVFFTTSVAQAQAPAPAAQTPGAPIPGTVRINPKDRLSYVWVPAGSFVMGCTSDTECDGTNVGGHVVQDEKPPHPVTMTKGFWIGQTEVTQAAYQKITSSNPSKFPGPKRPVEQVAWSAAQAYCKAVGMRLPTEAEWEYAARAGSTVPRYGDIDTIAWDQHNSGGRSHDVGQKTPNAWGLYDTVGNVWEWTSDWWSAQLPAAGTDPIGPSTGADRVTRGGAWNGGSPDIRASVRGRNAPARSYDSVGFRCAGEVP